MLLPPSWVDALPLTRMEPNFTTSPSHPWPFPKLPRKEPHWARSAGCVHEVQKLASPQLWAGLHGLVLLVIDLQPTLWRKEG